ncbi:hypothetical protein JHK84_047644 [Glycine max]|nr:hypothetical protein JHK85_048217 [Glycine max]KAG5102675.1 hypothetical protein JHK84_047644 [Glycine max]
MATMMASTYKAYLGVGLGPLEVGQIFQKFECGDESHGGLICNVVQCSIPNFLEDKNLCRSSIFVIMILQFLRTFKGQILVKDPRRSFLCGDELNSVLAENDSASIKSSKVTVSQSVQEGLLNDKGDTESEETVENVA